MNIGQNPIAQKRTAVEFRTELVTYDVKQTQKEIIKAGFQAALPKKASPSAPSSSCFSTQPSLHVQTPSPSASAGAAKKQYLMPKY